MILAALLFAANLGTYKDWPDSPQGYFLTKAERVEWAKVGSEAEAEAFVQRFLASRGAGFADEVAAAAKAADEHLTAGKKQGSKTLRGRIAIVLGPPDGFAITPWQGGGSSGPAATHASPWRPQTVHVDSGTAPSSELRAKFTNDYTFTYAKPEKVVIVVSVNPATGEDRILDARMARAVEELLEAAVQARAAKR